MIGQTFNTKETRNYRLVIKKFTPHTAIKEAFEETGNIVVGEIINSKFGPDKKPTTTFFVNLEAGPNNKAAKQVKQIYHQIVVIEDPRKRTTIVQCQRCQQYGHSKNYCMRPYRCLKCAEAHNTRDCPKTDRSTPATCALCLGPHPANYKGCEIYKEILARKTQKPTRQRNPMLQKEDQTTPLEKESTPHTVSKKQTYAETVTKNVNQKYYDTSRTENAQPVSPNAIETMFIK